MRSTGRFSRSDRLLDSRDFRRVSRHGRRQSSRYFVMLQAESRAPKQSERVRLGITVSRKVGNSVRRNYIKRNVREWFRSMRNRSENPLDVVVIARRDAARLRGLEFDRALEQLWSRSAAGAAS